MTWKDFSKGYMPTDIDCPKCGVKLLEGRGIVYNTRRIARQNITLPEHRYVCPACYWEDYSAYSYNQEEIKPI